MLTCFAASPTISTNSVRASPQHVVESLARRTRREFDSAFGGIAQWRSRASSADFVRHQGGPCDLAAEVAAEIRTGSEVDVSAEQLRSSEFDRSNAEERGEAIGEEVEEQVDVAATRRGVPSEAVADEPTTGTFRPKRATIRSRCLGRASRSRVVETFDVGAFPHGVAYDGTNIWVANGGQPSHNVWKFVPF